MKSLKKKNNCFIFVRTIIIITDNTHTDYTRNSLNK